MFNSFETFKSALDCPETHWAIDVYTPPDDEYRKVHDWTCRLHTRGYQLGKCSDLMRRVFRTALLNDDDSSELSVFLTPTGTAANALARAAVLDQNKSIILCSEMAHQADREAGSVEALTGSRALKPSDIFTPEEIGGAIWLDIDRLKDGLARREERYLNQRPWMISLSCPAEDGSIPSDEYMKKVAAFANENGMLFHMDGARLFVAAAARGRTIREMTVDMGVDIFSLGGSKVGMIGADAVVFTPHFFRKYPRLHHYNGAADCFDHFRSVLKRIGSLSGRSEETAAQFARAMTDGYGIVVGRRSHDAALALEGRVKNISGITLVRPVETNVLCIRVSKDGYEKVLKKKYPYNKVLERSADNIILRFQASHATTAQHVEEAEKALQEAGKTCPL